MADDAVQPVDAAADEAPPAADAAAGEPEPVPAPDAEDAPASAPPTDSPASPGGGVDWEERAGDLQSQLEEAQGESLTMKDKLKQEEENGEDLLKQIMEKDEKIEQYEADRDVDMGELTDELRSDLNQMQEDLEDAQNTLNEREGEMSKQRESQQRAEEDLRGAREESQRYLKDRESDKQEIDMLKGKVADMRKDGQKLKNDVFKEKKRAEEKNKNVNKYVDEIAELTKRDKELQVGRDEAQGLVDGLMVELDDLSAENEENKGAMKRMQDSMQEFETEKGEFDNNIARLEDQLATQEDEFEKIKEELEAEMLKLQEDFETTNNDLEDAQGEVETLTQRVADLEDDSMTGKLTKDLEDLQKTHAAGTGELDAITAEYDAQQEELSEIKLAHKELKRDSKKLMDDAVKVEQIKTQEANAELGELMGQHDQLKKRYDVLDDTVAEKDSEIYRTQARMDEMEQAVWGLPEAVKEVKVLTGRVSTRDKELKTCRADVSARERQLDDLRLEVTELRRRLGKFDKNGGEDDEGQAHQLFDLKELKMKEQQEMERLRALNEILTTENEQLEEERLELKAKLRFSASQRAQFALSMGLDAEQYSFLEKVAERMREDNVPDMPFNDRSRDLQEQLQRREDQITELNEKLDASDSYGDEIKNSLEEMRQVIEGLFKENRDLRSANLRFQPFAAAAPPPGQRQAVAQAPAGLVAQAPAPAAEAAAAPAPAASREESLANWAHSEQSSAAPTPAPGPDIPASVPEDARVEAPATPTRAAAPEPDDEEEEEDEEEDTKPKTSGAGTPLQRQVLRILGDAGLRMSGGKQAGAMPAEASEEIAKLKRANQSLLDNAMDASAAGDTGALKEQRDKAIKDAAKMRLQVKELKTALRKADLGVPWVPPMPSAAQHAEQTAAVVADAQQLATPQKAEAAADPPGTPGAAGSGATDVPYDDYVDIQTQLMEVLIENEDKEAQLTEMERIMAGHDRELQTTIDRQALLYREHLRSNLTWRSRVSEQQAEIKRMETESQGHKLELERYSNLDNMIAEAKQGVTEGSPIADKLTAQVMDMTRKATVLEVQEMLARRKAEYLEESEGLIRRQFNSLRDSHTLVEREMREKVVNLEQQRMETEAKLADAHAEMKQSVPKEHMDHLRAEHGSLMRRHQALVLEHSNAATQMLELKSMRTEILSLQTELDMAKTETLAAESKAKAVEKLMAEVETGVHPDNLDMIQLRRKIDTQDTQLKTFESRAINAERRADAHQKAEEAQTERVQQLDNQAQELSTKLREERDEVDTLRRELEGSVPRGESARLEESLNKATGDITTLKAERDKYKEIAVIATKQASTIQSYAKTDVEVGNALRKAIVDLQAVGEEKNIIAKLHMQVINARLVDVRKDEKAEAEQIQARRDRARVMELEEEADVLRSKLLRAHSENTKRERVLEKRLWDARDALSGCVKLEQQERTVAGANRLQAVNAELEKINRRMSDQKVDLESKLKEHELRIESDSELKKLQLPSVDKDTKEQALRDMSEKVLKLRVSESRLQRVLKNLGDYEQSLAAQNEDLEANLRELEEKSIKAEVQAEHQIEMMEQQVQGARQELHHVIEDNKQMKRKGVAPPTPRRGGGGNDTSPNRTPRKRRDVSAIDETIDGSDTIALKLREQVSELNDENTHLTTEMQNIERSVAARDTRVAELERHVQEARSDATRALSLTAAEEMGESARDTEESELLVQAQTTINRLQKDRAKKEDELIRYQDTLRDLRERAVEERAALEMEISTLSDKLFASKTDDVEKLRTAMGKLDRGEVITQVHYDKKAGTTNWMKDAQQWEETLAEKDANLEDMKRQVRHADLEIEKAKLADQHHVEELQKLKEELDEVRNRKPSDKLKKLVKTLKQQLALKEQQLQKLQQAIEALRNDLESSGLQQPSGGGGGGGGGADDEKMKELLDKQTKFVQKLAKMKTEIQQLKEREVSYKAELDTCRPAAEQLEAEKARVQQLEAEVTRLRREVDRLRKGAASGGGPGGGGPGGGGGGKGGGDGGDGGGPPAPAPAPAPESDSRVVELEQQVADLQSEAGSLRKAAAEAPAPAPAPAPTSKSSVEGPRSQSVAQWEAEKKMRMQKERLSGRLKESNAKLAKVTADLEEWQGTGEVALRDLKKEQDQVRKLTKDLNAALASAGPSAQDLDRITASEVDKRKIMELDAEVRRLSTVINIDTPQQVARLEKEAVDYKEQAAQLETMVKHHQNQLELATSESGVEQEWLEQSNTDLLSSVMKVTQDGQRAAGEVLRLENEGLAAKFSAEDAQRENTVLTTRTNELQALTEYLRRGQAAAGQGGGPGGVGGGGSPGGGPKGDRRKREREIELEAVIDSMKRVVEKQQHENEHLRKTGTTHAKFMDLTRENRSLKKVKGEMEVSVAELEKQLAAAEELAKRATQTNHTTAGVRRELKKAQSERERSVEHSNGLQAEVDEAHARAQVSEDSLERVRRGTDGALAQLRTRNAGLEDEAARREDKLAQVSAQLAEALQYQEELRARLGQAGSGGDGSQAMQHELDQLRRILQDGGAAQGSTPAGASMGYAELAELYGRLLSDRDRVAAVSPPSMLWNLLCPNQAPTPTTARFTQRDASERMVVCCRRRRRCGRSLAHSTRRSSRNWRT